ncbi:MAG: DUF1847 domain-containing protein [bacterium]|nr:DUF1847 domain-containing protein [bacterium]
MTYAKTNTPCKTCTRMKCRTESKDCYDIKALSTQIYRDEEMNQTAQAASQLIDNGRAGTLSRAQEIIEYCKIRNYKTVGIAHCFGLTPLAKKFSSLLHENDIETLPLNCTAGGVKERDIDPDKTVETVSCNPAGQAHILNKLEPDLIVEIGLCLGHDIIFHQQLKIPFTVLIVKDRIFAHNPAAGLTPLLSP